MIVALRGLTPCVGRRRGAWHPDFFLSIHRSPLFGRLIDGGLAKGEGEGEGVGVCSIFRRKGWGVRKQFWRRRRRYFLSGVARGGGGVREGAGTISDILLCSICLPSDFVRRIQLCVSATSKIPPHNDMKLNYDPKRRINKNINNNNSSGKTQLTTEL